VEYGIDGIRLDAITHLVEQENTNFLGTPKTHAATKRIRLHIEQNYPHIVMLGEVIGSTEFSKQFFGETDECHLAYNFELASEILYAVKMGDKSDRLAAAVKAAQDIPKDTAWMSFLRNHDSIQLNTLGAEKSQAFVAAADPHDTYKFANDTQTVQRLWHICNEDPEIVKEAFTLLYSLPTATVMYYGDEIGQKNAPLPPGELDMRYTVRGAFDWTEAEKQMNDPNSVFQHVKTLVQQRQRD
jgi:maltose alpha-D-glucosyltransferase/alpha-amylase